MSELQRVNARAAVEIWRAYSAVTRHELAMRCTVPTTAVDIVAGLTTELVTVLRTMRGYMPGEFPALLEDVLAQIRRDVDEGLVPAPRPHTHAADREAL